MSEQIGILITSAGKRCQLIECFRADALSLNLTTHIIAADLNPSMSPACQIADEAVTVPRCTDPSYIDALLDICIKYSITLLVPTIDTELPLLATAKPRFDAHGIHLAISTPAAIALSQDKYSTCTKSGSHGIPTPRSAMLSSFEPEDKSWNYPLILKPNAGSNSQGLAWASSPDKIPNVGDPSSYLVQECLSGTEYTTNCYFDQSGKLLAAVPHERVEVRGGEVSKAITRKIPQLEDIARRIEKSDMGWRGPICFQTIEVEDQHYLFEINARFGGGFPVAHRAGASFTKWLIQESLALPIASIRSWKDGVTMLRYDTAVYLDD